MPEKKQLFFVQSLVLAAIFFLAYRMGPHIIEKGMLDFFRHGTPFDRFALVMLIIFLVPPLCERLKIPSVLGLIATGLLFSADLLDIGDPKGAPVHFFLQIGRIFLMFVAGLEIDIDDFVRQKNRSLGFGMATFAFPMLAGVLIGRTFAFGWNASILIGSLLASHTLLGLPILSRLGLTKSSFASVVLGATIFTDIGSLLVLAICISVHAGGFSPATLLLTVMQVVAFTFIILNVPLWLWKAYFVRRRDNELTHFMFAMCVLLLGSIGAHLIDLEDIVGAFLVGLALNRALTSSPAREKLEFIGKALFIPIFFVLIGYRIDLGAFIGSFKSNLPMLALIVFGLLASKYIAAEVARLAFKFNRTQGNAMWSLSVPQVAATLAAAYAAYDAQNSLGQRLINSDVLNSIIVLMVVTTVLGPILTERFCRQIVRDKTAMKTNLEE